MALISVGKDSSEIENFLLSKMGVTNLGLIDRKDIPGKTKIFINGKWIGVHNKAEYIINTLKDLRRKKKITEEVSFVLDNINKEIKIYTDAGRIQRPLFIVENG